MRIGLLVVFSLLSSVLIAQKAPQSGAGPSGDRPAQAAAAAQGGSSWSKALLDALKAGKSFLGYASAPSKEAKEVADQVALDNKLAMELANFIKNQDEFGAPLAGNQALPILALWNTVASYLSVADVAHLVTLKRMRLSKPIQFSGKPSSYNPYYFAQFDNQANRVLVSEPKARLYDVQSGKELGRFCSSAYFSGVQDKLIMRHVWGCFDMYVQHIASGACTLVVPHDTRALVEGYASKGLCRNISPRQTTLDDTRIVACTKGKPTVFDMRSRKVLFELEVAKDTKINGLQFCYDGTKIVGEDLNSFIYIWDALSGKLIKKIKISSECGGGKHCPMFNKDGTKILFIWPAIHIFDIASEKTVSINRGIDGLQSVAFNHSGTRIIGLNAHNVMVWDAHSGVLLNTFVANMIQAIDFSIDDASMVLVQGGDRGFDVNVYRSPFKDDQLCQKRLTIGQMILLSLLEARRKKQEKIDWNSLAKNYDDVLNSFDAEIREVIIRDYSLENVGK